MIDEIRVDEAGSGEVVGVEDIAACRELGVLHRTHETEVAAVQNDP